MRRFAVGLSEHPLTAHAVGEVVGQVLETHGPGPDLALLFVTPPHAGAMEDAARAVQATLSPRILLGCAAESVVGGEREVEGEPAVVLWAGQVGRASAFHLSETEVADGIALTGWPDDPPSDASALLLLADPFTFPVEAFLANLAEDQPSLPVVGGMASAARGPGGNRLVIGERVVTAGAVGAFLGSDVEVQTIVSQGSRPVGAPFVVTKAERNLVYELGNKPALERLQELVDASSQHDRQLLVRGVHLGHVIDEHKVDFERGDFLVRNIIGADPTTGALAVGEVCEVGTVVQFHVRDADTADEDLRHLLTGEEADAALLFTCDGRGTRLFGSADHDASVLAEALRRAPVGGFFAAGELGPVGGRNFLHGFTASVALLRSQT